MSLNLPSWLSSTNASRNSAVPLERSALQERWLLRVADPENDRAFWLQFHVLVSANGFKRVAETLAIHSSRPAGSERPEMQAIAVRQSHEIPSCRWDGQARLRIGECEMGPASSKGTISSQGNSISWDLKLEDEPNAGGAGHELLPQSFRKFGFVRNSIGCVRPGLRVSGTLHVNTETIHLESCPASQGHQQGSAYDHSWTWGECGSFVDDTGSPAPLHFEGTTVRGKFLGILPGLPLTSLRFRYRGQDYFFHTFKNPLKLRSSGGLGIWDFQADTGELSFRGSARAEIKDFAGLVLEDTNGSLIYAAASKTASLDVQIFRSGKLESTCRGAGSAFLESGFRHRNPYVSFLL